MKINQLLMLAFGIIASVSTGCNTAGNKIDNNNNDINVDSTKGEKAVYQAQLEPLNSTLTGLQTSGLAQFVIYNDTMTITIGVKNAPPGIEHWQHFHGFAIDTSATCATAADDKNGDGIIDIVETGKASGTTMVPFNKMPADMKVGDNSYPLAGADGSYTYEVRVPMMKLKDAFAKAFGGGEIDLERRVVYIHGVPDSTKLPATVASLGDIPARVTLPIACGKIMKVE